MAQNERLQVAALLVVGSLGLYWFLSSSRRESTPPLTSAAVLDTQAPPQSATHPAPAAAFQLLQFGTTVTMPPGWSCTKSDPMQGLAKIECGGGQRFLAATAGDDRSIDAFDAHVLTAAPDLVKRKQRDTLAGHAVLFWVEQDKAAGVTTHAVFYRAGTEYTIHAPGDELAVMPKLRGIIYSVKPM